MTQKGETQITYTDGELLDYIKKYYEEHKKNPAQLDFTRQIGYPGHSTISTRFGNWNNALKHAGLEPTKNIRLTDEECLKELEDFSKELGKTPTPFDFKTHKNAPSLHLIRRKFGSLNKAYELVGFGFARKRTYSKKELLKYLNKFAKENKRPPLYQEFINSNGYPSGSNYRKFFGSWNNALKECGLSPAENAYGRMWKKWELFCEDLAKTIYGDVICQEFIPGIGQPDIQVLHKKLIIDAATSSRIDKRKLIQAKNYKKIAKEVQFWCIFNVEEIEEGIEYLYPEDLMKLVETTGDLKLKETLIHFMKKRDDGLENLPDHYTSQGLIKILRDYYKDNAKIPIAREWNSRKNRPHTNTYRKFFGSWSRAKIIAFGKTNKFMKLSRGDLINYIKKYYKLNNKLPKKYEFDLSQEYPSGQVYTKYFGSWNNALKRAGFEPSKNIRRTDEELLEYLKTYYLEKGKIPRAKDALGLNSTIILRFGSWNNALKLAGLPKRMRERKYTDEELIESLKIAGKILKRIPKFLDMSGLGLPSGDTIGERFGSWNNALKLAGFEPSKNIHRTDEELLEYLKTYYLEKGKIPRAKDSLGLNRYPGHSTIISRFGSWNNALKLAGLPKR